MRLKSTGSTALCPNPSLMVMNCCALAVFVEGSVAVNVPLDCDGLTVTWLVFELTAVNELTPVSVAVKLTEKSDEGQLPPPKTPAGAGRKISGVDKAIGLDAVAVGVGLAPAAWVGVAVGTGVAVGAPLGAGDFGALVGLVVVIGETVELHADAPTSSVRHMNTKLQVRKKTPALYKTPRRL
jgi:hypothetical protein